MLLLKNIYFISAETYIECYIYFDYSQSQIVISLTMIY